MGQTEQGMQTMLRRIPDHIRLESVRATWEAVSYTHLDVYKRRVTFREMEEIEENLILPSFRKLRFVDINKTCLLYTSGQLHARKVYS